MAQENGLDLAEVFLERGKNYVIFEMISFCHKKCTFTLL